jgi:tetratricopeptide (TPR) repeat protein
MLRTRRLFLSTLSLTLLLAQPARCHAEEIGRFERVIIECGRQLEAPITKEDWDKIRQSADSAYKAEHYRDSLPLFKKAIFTFGRRSDLAEVEKAKSDEAKSDEAKSEETKCEDLSVSLASNYAKLGNFDKARETYVALLPDDLSIEPAAFPRFSIQVLNGLTAMDLEQGYYADVNARCVLAKKIASKSNVLNSESLKTNILMADAQYQQGKLAESEAQYKDILKQAESLGPEGKGVRADALEGLSNIHLKNYDIAKSKEEAEQALALRKDAFGDESLEVASSFLTLAKRLNH